MWVNRNKRIISNCNWNVYHIGKDLVFMGHYVELFRIVRKVDGSMNKKNETLRNVQPWHNARSSEVSHNIKNTKQTQKQSLFCFIACVLVLTSCSLEMEQSVTRSLPMNSHKLCTIRNSPGWTLELRGVFQPVLFINSL